MREHLRIFVLPTQLRFFIKISRIRFPGNPAKIFISWDSASLTASNNLFEPRKISTGKNLTSRNSAYEWRFLFFIWFFDFYRDLRGVKRHEHNHLVSKNGDKEIFLERTASQNFRLWSLFLIFLKFQLKILTYMKEELAFREAKMTD